MSTTTILILVMIAMILSSLASGLFFLVTDKGRNKKIVRTLSIRVVLSISLFVGLFIAFKFGYITPHSLF